MLLIESLAGEDAASGLRGGRKDPSHPRIALFFGSSDLLDGVNSLDMSPKLLFGFLASSERSNCGSNQ